MQKKMRLFSLLTAAVMASSALTLGAVRTDWRAAAAESIEDSYEWGTMRIGGGGFVSGIITGTENMYARTDVGGAYRYDYATDSWVQLMGALTDAERGFLSVDAFCVNPKNDKDLYMLCGCAYFTDARTEIFISHDAGETFERVDVTDLIQVHGNGDGRQTGEAIAVDPDNPDVLYCGGDVTAGDSCLIKSVDGGKTWAPVKGYDDLGLFKTSIKWPMWTEHMTRALDDGEYRFQNGVATIQIWDGKVYVGTSISGKNSLVVADIKDDKFTDLSAKVDSTNFPSRIKSDGKGNLFITYQGAVCVGNGGASGGIYKYNTETGEVTNIAPTKNGFSELSIDPTNPDHMVTTTCGLWSAQLWQPWDDKNDPSWGDLFYKSVDGGKTWTEFTPGKEAGWNQPLISEYLKDGGYEWIRNKACHWTGSIVVDPRNPDRIHVTSGNGVFSCDNTWDAVPSIYFHPTGIEEVVALDMISIPGGKPFSAIGDYDGFRHDSKDEVGIQHQPNMGSTGAIAYCPQNPDVMVRYAENQNDRANGFYSTDGGSTWTKMASSIGGKAAIVQLSEGKYRFFQSSGDNATTVRYSDDFGETWTSCEGIPTAYGSKPTHLYVDPDTEGLVYAYICYYNSSWFYSKTAPDASDAQYKLCVSTDYGKTFTSTDVAMYDQCDGANRIAALGDGRLALAAGWYGLYIASEQGKKIEKTNVHYAKTVGYGAPEKTGGLNTLYIYGQPTESDPEGIYRSTDGGATWLLINSDHLFGGTGNGNFLVGDMNTFGTVYMSTVGCGIVVGTSGAAADPKPIKTTTTPAATTTKESTTTAAKTTTTTAKATTTAAKATTTEKQTKAETTGSTTSPATATATVTQTKKAAGNILYGDVNLDNVVDITDAVLLNKAVANVVSLNTQASLNADCNDDSEVSGNDAVILMRFLVQAIKELPYTG